METIFAEATPPGRGGVSIVRLSGPDADAIARAVAGDLPPLRTAAIRRLKDGGEVIDDALVLSFAEGASFTGEPVVEFHVHGAPVVVRRLTKALSRHGARLAGPGEFTRRSFVNGRLDLTRVQGLSDLLQAETEAQRVLAMRNASGELGRLAAGWREKLVRASALVMASIDFPDEDVPDGVPDEVSDLAAELCREIDAALAGARSAEQLRAGFRVAIIGPPNAGKSSLLNRLAGRDVAIVTDRPGTTRDLLEVDLDLGGLAVTVVDTAGLRETDDDIEALGIARAQAAAEAADLRLHLSEEGAMVDGLWQDGDLVVRTKADDGGPGVSSLTGRGLDDLLDQVQARLMDRVAGAGMVSHRMQADQLRSARAALSTVKGSAAELAAEGLSDATRALEALVGRVDIDEYLDTVFSSFCIGK